jgi:hypothetical protein
MRRRTAIKDSITGTCRQTLELLRAVGASTLLTMRLFDLLPEQDVRPRTAIVRQVTLTGMFDPRELLPNGMVLTLPLSADVDRRPGRLAEIGLN